jgi:hypothetical protein
MGAETPTLVDVGSFTDINLTSIGYVALYRNQAIHLNVEFYVRISFVAIALTVWVLTIEEQRFISGIDYWQGTQSG